MADTHQWPAMDGTAFAGGSARASLAGPARTGLAGPAHAGFRIANDSHVQIGDPPLHQGSNCETRRRRIATGVRNESRAAYRVAKELWHPIDRFSQQSRLCVRLAVPALVRVSRP